MDRARELQRQIAACKSEVGGALSRSKLEEMLKLAVQVGGQGLNDFGHFVNGLEASLRSVMPTQTNLLAYRAEGVSGNITRLYNRASKIGKEYYNYNLPKLLRFDYEFEGKQVKQVYSKLLPAEQKLFTACLDMVVRVVPKVLGGPPMKMEVVGVDVEQGQYTYTLTDPWNSLPFFVPTPGYIAERHPGLPFRITGATREPTREVNKWLDAVVKTWFEDKGKSYHEIETDILSPRLRLRNGLLVVSSPDRYGAKRSVEHFAEQYRNLVGSKYSPAYKALSDILEKVDMLINRDDRLSQLETERETIGEKW